MSFGKYILDKDGNPVEEKNLMKWARWFETGDRKVDRTQIGTVSVSTVFLGLDHSFMGKVPLLFETMVFGGKLDKEMDRYTTREEAVEGHKRMVKRVEGEL